MLLIGFKLEGLCSGRNWFDYCRQRVGVTPILEIVEEKIYTFARTLKEVIM